MFDILRGTNAFYSGQDVAYPFIGKPDRNLYRDYYEIIHHPVSLRSIQQRVRGTDSRRKALKTTAFPTWDSFEEEVSFLWRNAREYNEDGSEISALAGVLEASSDLAPLYLPLVANSATRIISNGEWQRPKRLFEMSSR